MKKQLQILILLLVIANMAVAQNDLTDLTTDTSGKISRVGLQFGMNSASMEFTKISDPSIYPTLEFLPRLNAGIYSESGATENFVFHIGLFYSGSGYMAQDETVTLDYVQVPL